MLNSRCKPIPVGFAKNRKRNHMTKHIKTSDTTAVSVFVFVVSLLSIVLTGASLASAENHVSILYINYPPYYVNEGDEPKGLLISKVKNLMEKAGFKADFSCYPSKRILDAIRHGEKVASIGWFKTKERESYARFSLPIYTNKAVGVFALTEVANKLSVFSSLKAIMQSRQFTLGLIAGHSEVKLHRRTHPVVSGTRFCGQWLSSTVA